MGFWNFLNFNKANEEKIAKAIAVGKTPTIGSSEELKIYLKYKIKDEEFSKIIVQIFDKIGRDGVIEIKRGGDGNPYQVEDVPSRLSKAMSKRERKKRTKEILEILDTDNFLSDEEIHKYQEELANLSSSHIIIWVNSESDEEFKLKEDLFVEARKAMEELTTD